MVLNTKQTFTLIRYYIMVHLIISFIGFALTEHLSIIQLQGLVFSLFFYKAPLLVLFMFLCIVRFTFLLPMLQLLAGLQFTLPWIAVGNVLIVPSAALHSAVLVFYFQALLISCLVRRPPADSLLLALILCILLGGVWVFFNGASFSLWSWDPVELCSLFMLLAFVVHSHTWHYFKFFTLAFIPIALLRFFRLGPAISAHHLITTSFNSTLTYIITLDAGLSQVKLFWDNKGHCLSGFFVFKLVITLCTLILTINFFKARNLFSFWLITSLLLLSLAWIPLVYALTLSIFFIAATLSLIGAFFKGPQFQFPWASHAYVFVAMWFMFTGFLYNENQLSTAWLF